MYRPLRRHTYHSVTNNTNNQQTIPVSHWSQGCSYRLLIGPNLHITTGTSSKKSTSLLQRGLASFSECSLSPIFLFLGLMILPGGTISLLGSTEANLSRRLTRSIRSILRGMRGAEGGDGANSDTSSVEREASQSLLITWNKVWHSQRKLSSGLEFSTHI